MNHSRLRRVLAPGLSEKAVKEQDPYVMKYVNLLMQKLAARSVEGPVDVNKYFQWVGDAHSSFQFLRLLPSMEQAGLTATDHARSHCRGDFWPAGGRYRNRGSGSVGKDYHRYNSVSGLVSSPTSRSMRF